MFEDLIKPKIVYDMKCPYHHAVDEAKAYCNGYKKLYMPAVDEILCAHYRSNTKDCALRQSGIRVGCDRWSICSVWPIECDRCIQ